MSIYNGIKPLPLKCWATLQLIQIIEAFSRLNLVHFVEIRLVPKKLPLLSVPNYREEFQLPFEKYNLDPCFHIRRLDQPTSILRINTSKFLSNTL